MDDSRVDSMGIGLTLGSMDSRTVQYALRSVHFVLIFVHTRINFCVHGSQSRSDNFGTRQTYSVRLAGRAISLTSSKKLMLLIDPNLMVNNHTMKSNSK